MDIPPSASPSSAAPATAQPVTPPLASWPRSVQMAVAGILAASLLFLAGKAFHQSLQAGSSTVPTLRVNINFASRAELLLLPGVGENLADRIIQQRSKALFAKIEDLRRVPGIGPAALGRLRGWVFFSSNPPPTKLVSSLPLSVEPFKRPGAKPKKGSNLTEPIDVNSATAAELMQIPGIGPKLSQRIIQNREGKPFLSVAELRRVSGIGPKILEKMRPFVTVNAPLDTATIAR